MGGMIGQVESARVSQLRHRWVFGCWRKHRRTEVLRGYGTWVGWSSVKWFRGMGIAGGCGWLVAGCGWMESRAQRGGRTGGMPCYGGGMSVNTTHPEYDAALPSWLRARDVLAGEDAVKAGGEKYLPRLDDQTDQEYAAYRARASFFNASARTADGYLGLVFRRPPFVKHPGDVSRTGRGGQAEACTTSGGSASSARQSALGQAMEGFVNDADMRGTSLPDYARNVVKEVVAVGRGGTLIDWEGDEGRTGHGENRAYASLYAAENIINWRTERINRRNVLSLVVLRELTEVSEDGDEFEGASIEQLRVLRLVNGEQRMANGQGGTEEGSGSAGASPYRDKGYVCVVEVWRRKKDQRDRSDRKE
jgi:hypothetical protein